MRRATLFCLSLALVLALTTTSEARRKCVKVADERMSSATMTVVLQNVCKSSPAKCWVEFDVTRPNGMTKQEKLGPRDLAPGGKSTYDVMIFSDSKVTYKWGCLDPKEFKNAATSGMEKLDESQKEMRPKTMDTEKMMDDSALLDD